MHSSDAAPLPTGPLESRYLYWTGCAANYDARIAAIVKATARIARAAGIELTFLGDEEACSGDAARRLGEEGLFQQLALQNIETLTRHGVQYVVTHCAHCFHVLKNEYPRFGGNFQVLHHTELIARILGEGRVKLKSGNGSLATLHDSCYVGRYNAVFDAPRDILHAVNGSAPIEMPRHGQHSFCCGAGGANYWYDAPKRQPAGVIRIREAAGTGATTVVAECPFCIKMLEQGAQAAGVDGALRVRDIAEVVDEAMEAGEEAAASARDVQPLASTLKERA